MLFLLYDIPLWWLSITIITAECDLLYEKDVNLVRELPLCCPIGWFLVKIYQSFNQNIKYDCLSSPLSNGNTSGIVTFESTYPIYGNGIQSTIKISSIHKMDDNSNISNISRTSDNESENISYYGIPKCDQQIFNILQMNENGDIRISSKSCLIKTATANIAAISCEHITIPIVNSNTENDVDLNLVPPLYSGEDEFLTLRVIHKCCPNNYIYNSRQRKCRISNKINVHNYVIPSGAFYGKYAIFQHGNIICPQHKVLMEYQVNQIKYDFIQQYHFNEYCIENMEDDEVYNGQYLLRVCVNIDICQKLTCIRRCCNDGEVITKGNATSYCQKDLSDMSSHSFSSLEMSANFSFPQTFGIMHGLDCLKYRLNPEAYADEMHVINQRDGSLRVPSTGKVYTNKQYCLEKINKPGGEDNKLYTFLCFDTKVVDNERIRFKLYPIGLLISCLFYAITLLIYLLISNLRNLPGKILICLVFNLFMAYLNIALGQLIPTSKENVCFAFGFLTYFCLMAAFAWMNVMCFDIWQTFGSTHRENHSFQKRQNKRFLIYSIYGWGLPILITVTTATITSSNLLSENLQPNFGHGRCWFTYDTPSSASLLFFSGPMGILFLVNFALFVLTLRYCNRVKREIFRMQSSNMEKSILKKRFFIDKARFAMNTKLFIVMGITWFLELLSIIFYNRKKLFLWVISDSFNVLLGVFVFIIFVFKKRIWYLALEKCHLRDKKVNHHHHTTISSHQTGVSCMQSTISIKSLNKINTNINYLKPLIVKRTPTM